MNCEHVEELLSAYLDNKLAMAERQNITAHLQTCSGCAGLFTDYLRFDALLSQMPRFEPEKSLYEKIFFSRDYKELTGTSGNGRYVGGRCSPSTYSSYTRPSRPATPHLTVITGGRAEWIKSDHLRPVIIAVTPPTQRHSPQWKPLLLLLAGFAVVALSLLGALGLSWKRKKILSYTSMSLSRSAKHSSPQN